MFRLAQAPSRRPIRIPLAIRAKAQLRYESTLDSPDHIVADLQREFPGYAEALTPQKLVRWAEKGEWERPRGGMIVARDVLAREMAVPATSIRQAHTPSALEEWERSGRWMA